MASLPTRRVNSPSNTSIRALPVLRNDLPRIKGTQGSASKSTTTKSLKVMASLPTRRVNSPSNTSIRALPVLRNDLPRIKVWSRLKVMASLPTRRVNSPSNTSIRALPVLRKDLPRIKGTQGSAPKSTTTKSTGK
nr:hypothetical protein [Tanacetum cinerariifolium]